MHVFVHIYAVLFLKEKERKKEDSGAVTVINEVKGSCWWRNLWLYCHEFCSMLLYACMNCMSLQYTCMRCTFSAFPVFPVSIFDICANALKMCCYSTAHYHVHGVLSGASGKNMLISRAAGKLRIFLDAQIYDLVTHNVMHFILPY